MRVTLNGIVSADDDKWIYEWFGYSAFSPQQVRDAIAANPEGEELVLEINSPGGSVFAGSEMYSVLKASGLRTRAEIQSLAASAASYLCLGCDTVAISPVAQMMIHLPSTSTDGDRTAHQRSIGMLDSTREAILNAYELKARGKSDRASLRRMMSSETWLTAQDALDHGLVDEILGQESQGMSPGSLVNAFGLPDLDALRAAYLKANPNPRQGMEPAPKDAGTDWRVSARLELERNRF